MKQGYDWEMTRDLDSNIVRIEFERVLSEEDWGTLLDLVSHFDQKRRNPGMFV